MPAILVLITQYTCYYLHNIIISYVLMGNRVPIGALLLALVPRYECATSEGSDSVAAAGMKDENEERRRDGRFCRFVARSIVSTTNWTTCR